MTMGENYPEHQKRIRMRHIEGQVADFLFWLANEGFCVIHSEDPDLIPDLQRLILTYLGIDPDLIEREWKDYEADSSRAGGDILRKLFEGG